TIAPTIAIDNPDCRIPRDAVEISAEDYAALLDAQSAGKQIVPDGHGHPIAVDPPPPSEAELAAQVRAERDRRLADSDWTQIGDAPASTAARWQPYRQALRDVPAQ
ncbi:phage tail assembly chaperone, partial [Chitinivorax sp. PXF-14]|uniref:phage tail assembly chaperone n=1 Tax=Chitinivorax sp. PXF-14 TaxID=3230488 RepID=UPI0034655072